MRDRCMGKSRRSNNNVVFVEFFCILYTVVVLHCVSKNIPDIFDCNLETNYQIFIIFGTNIPNITCHQMTVHFPT